MKKNSREWKKKESELKKNAFAILHRAELLKAEANIYYLRIQKFIIKYPDGKIEDMDWQEKERIMAEADILFGNLDKCKNKLTILDNEYEELRKEVNEFYGYEVMDEVILKDNLFTGDCEDDAADWWKK